MAEPVSGLCQMLIPGRESLRAHTHDPLVLQLVVAFA